MQQADGDDQWEGIELHHLRAPLHLATTSLGDQD